MGTRPWLWPVLAAVALIVTVTVFFSDNRDSEAASAIVQAQRDIAALEEGYGEIDPAALRAAEADLFAAYAAFDEKRYEAALEAALSASRAAQKLRKP